MITIAILAYIVWALGMMVYATIKYATLVVTRNK